MSNCLLNDQHLSPFREVEGYQGVQRKRHLVAWLVAWLVMQGENEEFEKVEGEYGMMCPLQYDRIILKQQGSTGQTTQPKMLPCLVCSIMMKQTYIMSNFLRVTFKTPPNLKGLRV